MMSFGILILVACVMYHADAQDPHTRLERDYDFDGMGQSYYLKTYVDDEYRLVCWIEEYWGDHIYWGTYMDLWCETYFMQNGGAYTGTDLPGEVELEMNCPETTDPGDCDIVKNDRMNCSYHVRVQCWGPMSDYERGMPLTGILVAICVVLSLALITSWIGYCCLAYSQKSRVQDITTEKAGIPSSSGQQFIIRPPHYVASPTYAPPPAQPGYPQQPITQALYPAGYTNPTVPQTPAARADDNGKV